MAVPFADVASWVVICSLSQELREDRVRTYVIPNVSVRGLPAPVDNQGMGYHDGAVLLVAEEDATGLPRKVLRRLGRDDLVCVALENDTR
jgi:hypothetical protein